MRGIHVAYARVHAAAYLFLIMKVTFETALAQVGIINRTVAGLFYLWQLFLKCFLPGYLFKSSIRD